MRQPFAIITFRASGPIKTWSDMRGANVHNARTKPIKHAISGAPPPEHLIGSGDLVADVRDKLVRCGLDPERLRKNGVIAYEAVLSASPEFFASGSEVEREERLRAWVKAQREWAIKRYGLHRIASLVLHLDEKTPHMHLVLLPLEVKVDKRRCGNVLSWGLVGRTISGPGKFDEVQDAYAGAMAELGLRRGERGSGRKHEPVPLYLKRLAEKEQMVDAARAGLERDRVCMVEDRSAIERDRAALELEAKDLAGIGQAAADEARRLAAERQLIVDLERHLSAEKASLARAAAKVRAERAEATKALQAAVEIQQEAEQLRAAAEADRQALDDYRRQLDGRRERLRPALAAARAFYEKVEALKGRELTRPALAAQSAATRLRQVVLEVPGSAADDPSFAAPQAQKQWQALGQSGR